MDRIAGLRRIHEQQFGIVFPPVRLHDGDAIGDAEYEIVLYGARYGAAEVHVDRVLAVAGQGARARLDGIETTDPAYGLPAWWIAPDAADAARAAGYSIIDPLTVLVTHFGEIVRGEVATLLTRATVVALLDDVRGRQPGLIEELVPQTLSVSDVQRVLQSLLSEGVSIANLDLIVEHLVDLARTHKDPVELTELIRQRLSYAICHQLRGRHGDLAVLSLDPRIENQLTASIGAAGAGASMAVEPRLAEQLLHRLAPLTEAMFRQGRAPVLLCGAEVRRHLKTLTRRSLPSLSILSVAEIPMRITLKSFDVVRLEP
jgi:flagellar biosynthesis protein FlhA